MLHFRLVRSSAQAIILMLAFSSVCALGAQTVGTEQDRSSEALQARLDNAESNYKNGKIDLAIEQATSLIDVTESSFFESDRVARDAKADLAVFQLKAGNSDQTAKLVRELLLN